MLWPQSSRGSIWQRARWASLSAKSEGLILSTYRVISETFTKTDSRLDLHRFRHTCADKRSSQRRYERCSLRSCRTSEGTKGSDSLLNCDYPRLSTVYTANSDGFVWRTRTTHETSTQVRKRRIGLIRLPWAIPFLSSFDEWFVWCIWGALERLKSMRMMGFEPRPALKK